MVPTAISDLAPWPDLRSAIEGALSVLHAQLGWDAWSVTRVEGGHQIVLCTWPPNLVPPGTAMSWEASFCRQMVAGTAPRVATVTAAVPAYASRGSGPHRDVAAYLGVPLVTRGQELFGTLCAVSFRAKPRSAARDLPLVEAMARMLSTLLAADPRSPSEMAQALLARR